MNSTVVVRANDQAEPSLVVFGRDDAGKPRASWFDAGSADLASKAADLMKMRVLRLETEEQKAVARQLAPGRVFASGRAFTPFARTAVFSQLVELAGDSSDPSTKGSTSGKPGAVASNGSAASGDQGPGPAPTAPADPKAGPLDRKAGTKSASAASCSRPSGSRTDGGKASSSASTAKRSP